MFRACLLIAVVASIVLLAGCGGSSPTARDKDNEKTYDIHGKVVAVDLEKKKVKIDHEDIPG